MESATSWSEWIQCSDSFWERQEAYKPTDNHQTSQILPLPVSPLHWPASWLAWLNNWGIGKPITLSMKNAPGWLIFCHDHHLGLRLLEDPHKDTPLMYGSLSKYPPYMYKHTYNYSDTGTHSRHIVTTYLNIFQHREKGGKITYCQTKRN